MPVMSWHTARSSLFVPMLAPIYGHSEAEAMWWWWYEKRTGGNRLHGVSNRHRSIPSRLLQQLRRDVEALVALCPLAYVLDEAWFLGRSYALRRSVLIPRPETEELVNWVLEREPAGAVLRLLDVGCGSGAIGCSISLERPNWRVKGMDIDPNALRVSRLNARRLGAPVRIYYCDMRQNRWPSWDVLVCNPPYIGQGMDGTLSPGVAAYEPQRALFAPDGDALFYYRLLANRLRRSGKPEIGGKGGGSLTGNVPAVTPSGSYSVNRTQVMYLELPAGGSGDIQELFGEFCCEVRADAQGVEQMLRVEGFHEI